MRNIPLSLYIHMPWCIKKCPYCDFNSHQKRGELPEEAYINCLIENFTEQLPYIQGREIQTIFIGGGTPSLISPAGYQKLFNTLFSLATFKPNAEITLEANPGTFEQQNFSGYREAGINRLSIGVQSFQDDKLQTLGRIHDSANALKAIEIARQAGFDNFNIDLMFGLPNQSLSDGLFDLQTAIDLNPTHLSWYQLTLEPNTYFYKHPPKLPQDENIWQLQQQGQTLLKQQGFEQYEISAYARVAANLSSGDLIAGSKFDQILRSSRGITKETSRGMTTQCQHNLNYWFFGDYLAIGAGAHGKVTDLNTGVVTRYNQVSSPKFYMNENRAYTAEKKPVTQNEIALEFFLNAFRLFQPISFALIKERTGLDQASITRKLTQVEKLGYLEIKSDHIALTSQGLRYLNEVLVKLC